MSTTASLYKSLTQAAPEIKECVDACNFIADSTREQNDVGSVSVCVCLCVCLLILNFFSFFFTLTFFAFITSLLPLSSLGNGELGADRQDDRQSLLLGGHLTLLHRNSSHLPHGPFQPGARLPVLRREQKIYSRVKGKLFLRAPGLIIKRVTQRDRDMEKAQSFNLC